MFSSYVAIGDSFTEGYGDDLPDGTIRGWADLVALGLAAASPEPVRYANLSIRGRKLAPLLKEQLQAAIDLRPQLISLNGGGNDILRPRVAITDIAAGLTAAAHRVVGADIHLLLLSGANPSRHLPAGRLIRRRGQQLDDAVLATYPRAGVTFVDNWADRELADIRYWSADRMHLNALGHVRVATNVLTALQVPVPDEWSALEAAGAAGDRGLRYYREYVLPWIGRRLARRSSGDGRTPKIPELMPVAPGLSISA